MGGVGAVVAEGGEGGAPLWPRRLLIDGIRFRVRTGAPWRDVPVEYGPGDRIYGLGGLIHEYTQIAQGDTVSGTHRHPGPPDPDTPSDTHAPTT
uniref:transposase n=1 Tax=Streptomyces rugosispiralis TaxID=2967341 RepID=UPI003703F00B